MEELIERININQLLYKLMDKYNQVWSVSSANVSATAVEMLQSGRLDTLLKNTFVCFVLNMAILEPKFLVGALIQGDDFMALMYKPKPVPIELDGLLKIDFEDVAGCIGYTFGADLCLDVYTMAAKLSNVNFYSPRRQQLLHRIQQYQTSMRDRMAPFVKTEEDINITCLQSAARYNTTEAHARAVLTALRTFASITPEEFEQQLMYCTAFPRVLETVGEK